MLMWTVRKNSETKFLGYDQLELLKKADKKRVGFLVEGGGIIREN